MENKKKQKKKKKKKEIHDIMLSNALCNEGPNQYRYI